MYAIPGIIDSENSIRPLLKYTIVTESGNYCVRRDTKLLIVVGAGGAPGGAGGGIIGTNGGTGSQGGNSSFGSIIFKANAFVGNEVGTLGLTLLGMGLDIGLGGINCGEPGISTVRGGQGGKSIFGSGGLGANNAAICGGGGGGTSSGAGGASGGGGASSGMSEPYYIENPSSNYAVVIGAGGLGGAPQAGATAGWTGGNGAIIVMEYA